MRKADRQQSPAIRAGIAPSPFQLAPSGALSQAGRHSGRDQNQEQMVERVAASAPMAAQRRAFETFHTGPRATAQRRAALAFSQVNEARKPVQLSQEEEPLQGKFVAQRVEEEEPAQGKFVTQRVEEEEPVQGKPVAQRVEEEEPVQGKAVAQRVEEEEPLQGKFAAADAVQRQAAGKASSSGLPENLRSGVESLSGLSMDHVKVHYNSSQPAQLNAHAFAQGSEIHVAPGQERHLPHEAWHVVQQAQGRVRPTTQMKSGVPVNDDAGLEHEADVMGAKALATYAPKESQSVAANTGFVPVQRVEVSRGEVTKFRENLKWGDKTSEGLVMEVNAPLVKVQKPNGKKLWVSIDEITPRSPAPSPKGIVKPYHHAVTMNFEEPAKADPQAAKISDEPAKKPETGEPVQVNPHPALPEDQKSLLAKQGKDVVDKVAPIGGVVGNIKDAIGKLADKDALMQAGSITQAVGGILSGVAAGIVNSITMFVMPLKNAYVAVKGMMAKWSQWGAYKEHAKAKLDEAVYGEKKAKHGFFSMVINFSLAFVDFLANLLTLIPGAQIVGGPMKVLSWIAGAVRGLATSVFKRWFSSDKKTTNSDSLVTKAMDKPDTNPSAELLFKLKLDALSNGAAEKKEDASTADEGAALTEKKDDEKKKEGGWFSKVKGFFGGAKDKASEIADKAGNFMKGRGWKKYVTYLEANDGKQPGSGKDVQQGLNKLKAKGGEEALLPIKDEVKESMTGLTAGT